MDALFSIPMLSFLLIPTMSSYSTSLNLLFFYLTWTTLVLSHPPLRVEIVGTIAVRLLFYLLPSLLFFLFDVLAPSAAVVLKEHGKHGLPQGKRKKVGKIELKVAAWSAFNLFLGIIAQGVLEYCLTKVFGMKSALKVSTRLPLPWGIAKDLIRALLIREVLQYVVHRYVLHSDSNLLARYHDAWYHSLHTPYPLTAHYDHPFAYLCSHFFPTYLPAALFRSHLLTFMLYLVIVSLEETFAYSGYKSMPTSFFIGGIASRVDLHLSSEGMGNYAALGIMDWAFGTKLGNPAEDEESEDSETFDLNDIAERVKGKRPKQGQSAKARSRRTRVS